MESADQYPVMVYLAYGTCFVLLVAGLWMLVQRRLWRNFAKERASGTAANATAAALERRVAEQSEAMAGNLASLQHERALADSLLDSVPAIVVLLTPNGAIDRVNPYFEQLTGYRLDEIRGKDWISLFIPEPERHRISALFKQAVGGTPTRGNVNAILLRNGEERLIEWSDSVIRDPERKAVGLLAVGHDVTESKEAEQRLRESEDLYRGLYESMRDAFVLVDMDGRVVECNAAYEQMLGYTKGELRQLTYMDLTPSRWHEIEREIVKSQLLARGYSDIYQKEYRRKDGSVFPIEIRAFMRRGRDGKYVGSWGIVRDISDRKQAELELRQSRELLRDAVGVADIGIFVHDQITDTIYWSPEQRRIYGWSAAEPVTLQKFLDHLYPEDKPAIFDAVKRAHDPSGNGRYDVEHRILRRDGAVRWLISKAQTFFENIDGSMRPVRTVGVAYDVTTSRAVDEALRESELRLRQAQSIAKVGNWTLQLDSGHLWWSDEVFHIFEINQEQFGASYESFLDAIHPEDREAVNKAYRESVASRTPYQITHRLRMPDGTTKWVEERCQTTYDDEGNAVLSSGTVQDITERVKAEQAIRQRESLLRAILENSPTEIALKDLDLKYIAVSKNFADDRGSTMADAIGKTAQDFFAPEIADAYEAGDRKVLASNEAVHQDIKEVENGVARYIHNVKFPLRDDAGHTIGTGGLSTDMTEVKRIELGMQALSTELIALEGAAFYELAAMRLAELLDAEYAFISRIEPQHAGQVRTIALVECRALQPNVIYRLAGTPTEDVLRGRSCIIEQGARTRYPADLDLAAKCIEAYGGEPLLDQVGQVLGHVVVMSRKRFRDVTIVGTLLKMFAVAISAAIMRERNRRQYIDLFEFAPSGLVMVDQKGNISLVNRQAEEMFGWNRSELLGKPIEILVPPELREAHLALRRPYQASNQKRQMAADRPLLRGHRKDGTQFPAEIDLAPVQSESGTMIAAAVRDVTSRQLLEAQLAQATKMEAIGNLTGGMAHDFNNYLGVIIGNLDLLKERKLPDAQARKLVESALAGALRGAEVTESLLAFARRKPVEVDHVSANSRIAGITRLLVRTLGKDIKIVTKLAPDLWPVKVDGAQLDSCIVNLAGNARDAMSRGGTVSIRTENVRLDEQYAKANSGVAVGDYVMIEVSDTGAGMTEDVLARAFEPFFTTKGPGHGSGLGLSMVYGFVKQSGGHVKIYSEVEHGTSVRIYLPRGYGNVEGKLDAPPIETVPQGQGQVILVVEDNADLREASVAQLALLGYDMLEAANSADALAIVERNGRHVDLLFTDVVMPGPLNGFELAKTVTAQHPDIKVLLASGFPGETLRHNGTHSRKWQLLRKPYRMEELGRAVHAALQSA